MLVNKWGSTFDTMSDEFILKVSNEVEVDTDDEEFFNECLYKNRDNMLYIHITWGQLSYSPAKKWFISEYGSVTDGAVLPVNIADCKKWLKFHHRNEDIEYYATGFDLKVSSIITTLLEDTDVEEF